MRYTILNTHLVYMTFCSCSLRNENIPRYFIEIEGLMLLLLPVVAVYFSFYEKKIWT